MTKSQFKKRWKARYGYPRFPWSVLWAKYLKQRTLWVTGTPLWFWGEG